MSPERIPPQPDPSRLTTEAAIAREVEQWMTGSEVPWHLRYLAGRADRALTHLARAVDAAAFVVGTHVGRHRRMSEFLTGTLALQLSHRQHRPVLVVPTQVVDWQARAPWE